TGEEVWRLLLLSASLFFRERRRMIALGLRVGEPAVEFGHCSEHFGCPVNHPTHLATPLHVDFLAWLDFADVDLDGGASRLGPFAGPEAHHEWHCCGDGADASDHRRRTEQEPALPLVHSPLSSHVPVLRKANPKTLGL